MPPKNTEATKKLPRSKIEEQKTRSVTASRFTSKPKESKKRKSDKMKAEEEQATAAFSPAQAAPQKSITGVIQGAFPPPETSKKSSPDTQLGKIKFESPRYGCVKAPLIAASSSDVKTPLSGMKKEFAATTLLARPLEFVAKKLSTVKEESAIKEELIIKEGPAFEKEPATVTKTSKPGALQKDPPKIYSGTEDSHSTVSTSLGPEVPAAITLSSDSADGGFVRMTSRSDTESMSEDPAYNRKNATILGLIDQDGSFHQLVAASKIESPESSPGISNEGDSDSPLSTCSSLFGSESAPNSPSAVPAYNITAPPFDASTFATSPSPSTPAASIMNGTKRHYSTWELRNAPKHVARRVVKRTVEEESQGTSNTKSETTSGTPSPPKKKMKEKKGYDPRVVMYFII